MSHRIIVVESLTMPCLLLIPSQVYYLVRVSLSVTSHRNLGPAGVTVAVAPARRAAAGGCQARGADESLKSSLCSRLWPQPAAAH